METKNLRNICLNMLLKTLEEGALSHQVIGDAFRNEQLEQTQRAFLKRFYTGALEKLVYLDFVIGSFSKVPVSKLKPVIRNILRMGIYQLRFMDSVPAYTVIDESVKLTRKRGFQTLCPFVNAVLRKTQREADDLQLPAYVKALFPEWIYRLVSQQYGKDIAQRYFTTCMKEDTQIYIWLNEAKADARTILDSLAGQGCQADPLPMIPASMQHSMDEKVRGSLPMYALSGFSAIPELKAFQEGQIMIQDPSAVRSVTDAVPYIRENGLTIDVCAAPGGKSLVMSRLYPGAMIRARDLTDQKVALIGENIRRLGVHNIHPEKADARIFEEALYQKADVVIADLPCSGLGVIRKKPDILYRLKEADPAGLQDLQRSILDASHKYVKPGGLLIYSTCTINKNENEENAHWFSRQYEFDLLKEETMMPGEWAYDGFYYAYFRKR